MKKFVCVAVLFSMLGVSSVASPMRVSGGGGLTLIQNPTDTFGTTNRISLAGIAGIDFFNTPSSGLFGIGYLVSRGFKSATVPDAASTASFFDLVGGFTWLPQHVPTLFVRIGGYVAIPLERFYVGTVSLASFGSSQTKTFFGLYADAEWAREVSPGMSLGGVVWGKLPFGSAIETFPGISVRFFEIGAGLKLGWL